MALRDIKKNQNVAEFGCMNPSYFGLVAAADFYMYD